MLLPAGRRLAQIFGPGVPELSPQEKELQAKVMKAMMQNAAYLRDSAMTADPGQMFARLGLTQQEMEAYGKIAGKATGSIRITGADSLEVSRNDKLIVFRGSGLLHVLDSLQIDPGNDVAIFRGQRIPFKEKTGKSNDIPFKGAWTGYLYSYEPMPDGTEDLQTMMDNLVRYTLFIGRVRDTGETVLFLLATKMVNKRMVLNVSVPCLFK
jgi:hypothetical protein